MITPAVLLWDRFYDTHDGVQIGSGLDLVAYGIRIVGKEVAHKFLVHDRDLLRMGTVGRGEGSSLEEWDAERTKEAGRSVVHIEDAVWRLDFAIRSQDAGDAIVVLSGEGEIQGDGGGFDTGDLADAVESVVEKRTPAAVVE